MQKANCIIPTGRELSALIRQRFRLRTRPNMSGAEAGLVLGLISSTITIIDTIVKVYNDVKDAGGIPITFREITRRLPLIRNTLGIAEAHITKGSLDGESGRAIKPIVEGCKDKALRLEIMFRKVVPQANISGLDRYRIAIRALGKGNQVEALMKGMLEDVQLLAGNYAIKASTEAEVERLVKAIEELSAMPPSLSKDTPGDSINNYGSGTLNANAGDGTQNNNTGSGKQFIGEKQYFGEA